MLNGADVKASGHMLRFHHLNHLGQPTTRFGPLKLFDNSLGAFDDLFPLCIAVEYHSEPLIDLLLYAGADVDQKTANGMICSVYEFI